MAYGGLQSVTLIKAFADGEDHHRVSVAWNVGFDLGTGLGAAVVGRDRRAELVPHRVLRPGLRLPARRARVDRAWPLTAAVTRRCPSSPGTLLSAGARSRQARRRWSADLGCGLGNGVGSRRLLDPVTGAPELSVAVGAAETAPTWSVSAPG